MIGKMDRKVTVQFRSLGTGVYGEPLESFGAPCVTWAEVRYKNTGAGEAFADSQEFATERAVFILRYQSELQSLQAHDQIAYDGKTWDIENVTEIGRNYTIRVLAKVVK